jgi:hypothetical protein
VNIQEERTRQISGWYIRADPDKLEKLFDRIIAIGHRQDIMG